MKKSRIVASIVILVVTMFAGNFTAQGATCSEGVDMFCTIFGKMSAMVNKITTVEQLDNINFDSAVENVGLENVPDECMNYVLTKADKTKLNNAYNSFIDSMVNKMYKLLNGMLSKSDIEKEFTSMRTVFKSTLDKSRTFEQFLDNVSAIF